MFQYLTDAKERENFFEAAKNPQDHLEHSIYIGVLAWVNLITPIVLWTAWMNKDYYTTAGKNIWNKNKWYKYGWWLFVIGYPLEFGVPALIWPFTFVVKKYLPAIYCGWLLFLVSLTWWAVNLGTGTFWIIGALNYNDVGGTNDLFDK